MTPVVQVLKLSDSFSQIWETLASPYGGKVVVEDVAELAGDETGCALILAAGGAEETALEILGQLRRSERPIAVVGAEADHRLTVALLKAGADNVFLLPAELSGLRAWIEERTDAARDAERVQARAADLQRSLDFSKLIGNSPGLREALERAARVIPRGNATVLVTGETGTGKELIARAIHFNGPRKTRPFVEINCAALPPNLLEAELFGFEKGAFTDAKTAKPGLFEAAHGGTLFLDEIGDLSLELQGKLLRALETRRVRRLGSVRDVEVDVRIIAATHVDLAAGSREGRFRSDLYYRLGVVPIHLPPLRERGEDIYLLAEHFLGMLAREYELPRPQLTPEVRRVLLRHTWPGNVRELRNALERALVLGEGALRLDDLVAPDLATAPAEDPADGLFPFPASLREIETAVARETLRFCRGNKSEAAKILGVSRRHLYVLLGRGSEEE